MVARAHPHLAPPTHSVPPQEENQQNTSMTIIRHNILSLKEVSVPDMSRFFHETIPENVRKVVFPRYICQKSGISNILVCQKSGISEKVYTRKLALY